MAETLPSRAKQEPEIGYVAGFTDRPGLEISEREHPDAEARFAMSLLQTNSILMGTPDGEDSSGRAKLNVMPPQELAVRALDISQAFFAEARKRDCMILLPTRDEITAGIEAEQERQEQAKAERRAARVAAKETADA